MYMNTHTQATGLLNDRGEDSSRSYESNVITESKSNGKNKIRIF